MSLIIAGCSSNSSSGGDSNGEKVSKADTKPIKLKTATYVANTSSIYVYVLDPWMKRVEELTKGKVKFDVYPGEQLGKAQDMLKLTRDGVMDVALFPDMYFPDNMPLSSAIAGLPDLSETSKQGTLAYNDLLNESKELMDTDFKKNGIVPVFTHVSPNYEIWTTGKKVLLPKDLKGKKIRTPGGIANEFYEYLGVTPVTIAHPEVYEALDKGVIDAVSYYSQAVTSSGTQDILRYSIQPHTGTAVHSLVVNEKVWSKLPKDVQDAMNQAGQELVKSVGQVYDEDTNKINDDFVKSGGNIVKFAPEEEKVWEDAKKDFLNEWLKKNESKGIPYEKVLNLYKEKLEKYK